MCPEQKSEKLNKKISYINQLKLFNTVLEKKLIKEGGYDESEQIKQINITFKHLFIKYLIVIIFLIFFLSFFEVIIQIVLTLVLIAIEYFQSFELFEPVKNLTNLNGLITLFVYAVLLLSLTKSIFNLTKLLNIKTNNKLSSSYIALLVIIPILSLFGLLSYLLKTSDFYNNYPNLSSFIITLALILGGWLLWKTGLVYLFLELMEKVASTYYYANYIFSLLTIVVFCLALFLLLNSTVASSFLSFDYIKTIIVTLPPIEKSSLVSLSSFGLIVVISNKLIETYFDTGIEEYKNQVERISKYKKELEFNNEQITKTEREINYLKSPSLFSLSRDLKENKE